MAPIKVHYWIFTNGPLLNILNILQLKDKKINHYVIMCGKREQDFMRHLSTVRSQQDNA